MRCRLRCLGAEQPFLTPIRIQVCDAVPPLSSITVIPQEPAGIVLRAPRVGANASDSPPVSPTRSASSTSSIAPAYDTNP
jgi:hypothetical protein